MRFPVVLKTAARTAAPGRLWYEVASNGLFQVRETEGYRAVTQVDGVPGLHAAREEVELRFPRLPAALLEPVLAFFREVCRLYRGEAVVVLFFAPGDGELRVGVPEQSIPVRRDRSGRLVAHYELRYGHVETPAGFLRLGTIHSHADLPARASAVDCHDEQHEDGLHVIYGHLDSDWPSRSAAFVANGVRFSLDPEQVLEDCRVPAGPAPAEWLARLALDASDAGGAVCRVS